MFPIVTESDTDYNENTFVNSLPAYNNSPGNDTLLDLTRIINDSDNYYQSDVGFPVIPVGVTANFAANETKNGTVTVPSGSYVVSLAFYCSKSGGNDYGMKINLYDKGTRASIFYGNYCLDKLVMSNMSLGVANPATTPFGLRYFVSPFIITPPGNLNWEIVNLAPGPVLIQICAQMAIPINNQSINMRDIKV